jgi:hypothetical protein
MMFRRRPEPVAPDFPVEYPDGVMVRTEKDTYLIKGGRRLRCYSDRVVMSWGLPLAPGTEVSVSKHKLSISPLGFRDGTLIQDVSTGKLYLISGFKRRQVLNPDLLPTYGLDRYDALEVSAREAKIHEEGEPLE